MLARTAALLVLALNANGAWSQPSPPLADPAAGLLVQSIRPLKESAGRVAWSIQGDWIAFERPDAEGYLDIWVARPDATQERCLTCLPLEFRKRHAGDPTWHPSGRHIVFLLERPHKEHGDPVPFGRVPGANRGDDLWAISVDGQQFHQLTRRGEHGGHVLSPRFSHEGDRLVWSERVESGGGAWGGWVLRVGRFSSRKGLPALRKVKTHTVGGRRVFYEPYGFTTDDRGILFAANLDPGQSESSLDLYSLRLENGEVRRLTSSATDLDRFAGFSPDGRWIIWSSSRDLGKAAAPISRTDPTVSLPLDLWMMTESGNRVARLTRLNDPISNQYAGQVTVTSPAWSPDGDRLLVLVTPLGDPGAGNLYSIAVEPAPGDSSDR